MPSVTIDATVLAIPDTGATREEALQYVENLLDWGQILDEKWNHVHMSKKVADVLAEAGMYPYSGDLKALFTATGIEGEVYNANTVAPVVEKLRSITPTFEDYFRIEDALYENLTIIPDPRPACPAPVLADVLERYIVLIALLRDCCMPPILDHTLVARSISGLDHADITLHVTVQVHDVDHKREDLLPWPVPPAYFNGSVVVCQNFRALLQSIDDVALWDRAGTPEEMEIALRLCVYKLRVERGGNPDWSDSLLLHVGQRFRAREREVNRNDPPSMLEKILRAIAETHEGLHENAEHALRTTDAGGAPQRVRRRDGAKAWRRDIDRDHHLHYWRGDNNLIELSWLSYPHNDFDCPE